MEWVRNVDWSQFWKPTIGVKKLRERFLSAYPHQRSRFWIWKNTWEIFRPRAIESEAVPVVRPILNNRWRLDPFHSKVATVRFVRRRRDKHCAWYSLIRRYNLYNLDYSPNNNEKLPRKIVAFVHDHSINFLPLPI